MGNNVNKSILAVTQYSTEELQTVPLGIDIGALEVSASEVMSLAHNIMIVNEETLTQAIDDLGRVKQRGKEIETRRKGYSEPLGIITKRINGLFMPIINTFENAERLLKTKIGNYQIVKEKAAREERERLDREYQKAVAAEEKKAEKKGIEPKYVPPPAFVEEISPTTRGSAGSATVKMVWKHEVIDASKVPLMYCSPDPAKIRTAVASGVRKMPGVRIWEEPSVAVR